MILTLIGCAPDASPGGSDPWRLTLAAFTTPREAYAEILPAFAARELQEHGRGVVFEESYQASGAQSRAVAGGFEADIVALSLAPDVTRLQEAGLVTSDWTALPHGGMVTESIVVIAVRAGNPENIQDWDDLARPGVEVLTPNVRTSGGAMWNVAALWGAAVRGHAGVAAGDEAGATALLSRVLANVSVMDKGGRESLLSFERGVGDAAITYENEVLASRRAGNPITYVVPSSTLVVENPAAVVDAYTKKHGTEAVAGRFVSFLHEQEAQAMFAAHDFRPADQPQPAASFTVRDLGGWDAVIAKLFADGAIYDQAIQRGDPR